MCIVFARIVALPDECVGTTSSDNAREENVNSEESTQKRVCFGGGEV